MPSTMPSVAYQGEPGAFSEQAARAFFGGRLQVKPVGTFDEVFQLVKQRKVSHGIIPIENSLFGSVHRNYDLLLKHRLSIVGEVKLRIRLHVMALRGVRLNDLRTIYSHPQALGQCESFLGSLGGTRAVAYDDTAGAARMIAEERRMDAGAIASAEAARRYGLTIIRKNVEDNHQNFTRFLVLATKPIVPEGKAKTSIVFGVKNVPGALFKALGVFAMREINLLKIESRPLVRRPWEYLFYLDVEAGMREERLRRALNHVKELSTFVHVLGSYPPGKTVQT